jgi:hypothetical protein
LLRKPDLLAIGAPAVEHKSFGRRRIAGLAPGDASCPSTPTGEASR